MECLETLKKNTLRVLPRCCAGGTSDTDARGASDTDARGASDRDTRGAGGRARGRVARVACGVHLAHVTQHAHLAKRTHEKLRVSRHSKKTDAPRCR